MHDKSLSSVLTSRFCPAAYVFEQNRRDKNRQDIRLLFLDRGGLYIRVPTAYSASVLAGVLAILLLMMRCFLAIIRI